MDSKKTEDTPDDKMPVDPSKTPQIVICAHRWHLTTF